MCGKLVCCFMGVPLDLCGLSEFGCFCLGFVSFWWFEFRDVSLVCGLVGFREFVLRAELAFGCVCF